MSLSRRLANLGKAIDSATTGHFLSKGDSDGLFETIQYTDLTGRPTVLDSADITSLIDSAYIQLRQTTSGGSGGLDSAAITNLVDSAYVSARSPAAASGFAAYEYNTSAAQTTFQDSDVNGNVLSYSENGIIVYYNGVLMPTSDYTATDGSSVVFTTAVDSGGTVTIAKWALASSGGSGGGSAVWYGDRGVFMGGLNSSYGPQYTIDYITIASPGNATDFGDMTTLYGASAGASDGTYGVAAGGVNIVNNIEYITIASPGNSTDFGDLTRVVYRAGGVGDGTYGVFAGGYDGSGNVNTIDYVTIASPGNAIDFGDLTSLIQTQGGAVSDGTYGVVGDDTGLDYFTIASPGNATSFGSLSTPRGSLGAAFDTTYGLFAGGFYGGVTNVIDYITIASPGNATDFGDLTQARYDPRGVSDATYGVFGGGDTNGTTLNVIDYVTIASPGNASDFGDLTAASLQKVGASGSPS